MFLCKDCHIHGDNMCKVEEWAQSYGRCENCECVESCTDCKYHHRAPLEKLGKLAKESRTIAARKKDLLA